jgi:hypothetical protein
VNLRISVHSKNPRSQGCGNYLPRFAGEENQGEIEMSTKVQKNEQQQQQQNNERKFPRPKAWALKWDRCSLSEEQNGRRVTNPKSR